MTRTTIGAALLSALLLWAASPAVGAGWLVWVAIAPVAWVALAAQGSRAARVAVPLAYCVYLELLLVPALPFGLAEGQWGESALPVLIDGSPVLPVAFVAIPLFGLLLYALRFGEPWGADLLGPRARAVAVVVVPALAWTGLDLVRAKLEPGGSWGPLYLTQIDVPASELAALGGPWLVTLAIVAFNYGLALAVVRRRPLPALAPAGAIVAALVLATALDRDDPDPGTLTVAAIQPGYDTAEDELEPELLRYWDEATYNLSARDLFRDLAGLTARAARAGAELVVWPEAVAFVDLNEREAARAALFRVARSNGVTILAPYFDHATRNGAALAVSPSGAVTGPRPKQRAMWFLGEEDDAPVGPRPLRAAATQVGTLLGIDVQDPGLAGALADRDAELIASSTHDWAALATQHRALAALGAKASGVPVVRADWRYGSAIYDRDGEPVADAGADRRRTFVAAELGPGSPTPYARLGDVVGWVSLVAAAVVWLSAAGAGLATRRRRIPAWDSAP